MTALPPMSGRAFRAEFMREDRGGEFRGEEEINFDHDPYERCDFDEEDE